MPVDQAQRPRFYQGQYLGPDDLTATLEHARVQEARHRLGAHSWGIAVGLNLSEVPSPAGNNQVDVFLTPGYAWDGFARPVVVLAPFRVPPDLFQGIPYDPTQDAQATPGRLIKVWLRYREYNTQPAQPGFEVCDVADQNSRVRETFQLEVGERSLDQQFDPLSVAGRSVDSLAALKTFDPQGKDLYDRSVPHQVFPEDDPTAVWLIPLGYVRWLPNQNATLAGSFVQRTPDDLAASWALRQYIGVVVGSVLAADKAVRIKDRSKPFSQVPSDDLLWVEGAMRVQGDASLFGGSLTFVDANGQENKDVNGNAIPMRIQRADQAGTGSSLQVVIGTSNQGADTFAVGTTDASTPPVFTPKVTVRDDGRVGIGTTAPGYLLDVADRVRVRQGGSPSAGLWFFQNGPSRDQAFVGMATDNAVGFYGTALGKFGLVMDATSGKVGIGTTTPALQLDIRGDFGQDNAATAVHLFGSRVGDDGAGNLYLRSGGSVVAMDGGDNLVIGASIPENSEGWSRVLDLLGSGNAKFSVRTSSIDGRIEVHESGWSGAPAGMMVGTKANYPLSFLSSNACRMTIATSGSVGIGTTLPGYTLDVNGDLNIRHNLYFSGFLFPLSDARLKRDIAPLDGALESLLKLRGVRFFWKEPEKVANRRGVQMGLVAQEVEQVFPEWVREDPEGYKRIGISGFEALAIEAFREVKEHLDKLEKGLAGLERRKRRSP